MADTERERGFTLIEVMIGSAIAVVILSSLVTLAHFVASSATHVNARVTAASAARSLQERMQSDAASAWALWVPAHDVLGNANSDGHELDFFAEDASHRAYAWAYTYETAAQSVTRYVYAPGVAPIAAESYEPIGAFVASAFPPSALADPTSGIYDPLFANTTVIEQRHDFGVFANAYGGNDLFRVQITANGSTVEQTLASATAPSSFTIVVQYTPSPGPVATATPTPLPIGGF